MRSSASHLNRASVHSFHGSSLCCPDSYFYQHLPTDVDRTSVRPTEAQVWPCPKYFSFSLCGSCGLVGGSSHIHNFLSVCTTRNHFLLCTPGDVNHIPKYTSLPMLHMSNISIFSRYHDHQLKVAIIKFLPKCIHWELESITISHFFQGKSNAFKSLIHMLFFILVIVSWQLRLWPIHQSCKRK